jgi:hypothetical protein
MREHNSGSWSNPKSSFMDEEIEDDEDEDLEEPDEFGDSGL